MTHPIAVCLDALHLYFELAKHSYILNNVPPEKMKESINLVRTPEHEAAFEAYKSHVQTCKTCIKAINDREPSPTAITGVIA